MRIFVEKLRALVDPNRKFDPEPLYQAIVSQARTKKLYQPPYDIPNTLDGRYDSLCLHVFLVLRRFSGEDGFESRTQKIQNRFFNDMDQTMREIGVGDMTVGKHVNRMAKAYFGRVVAYEESIASPEELANKLLSNVFRGEEDKHDKALRLSAYTLSQVATLEGQSTKDLISGKVEFVQP